MPDNSLPDGFQLDQNSQAQSQPQQNPSQVPDGFQLDNEPSTQTDNQAQYGTGSQQAIAGLEGAAQGVAGPLATLAEIKLLGVNPEDIAGRAEANPWTHGIGEGAGLIGGAFIPGLGEYSIGAKIGEAANFASKSAELGKFGSMALKGAIEGGLFQASDEGTKYILGQSDPDAPVSSALTHIAAAGLFGSAGGALFGAAGNKLQDMADSKLASSGSQFLNDFASRWKFNTENPDFLGSLTDEINNVIGHTDDVARSNWGAGGLKELAAKGLANDVGPDQVFSHVNDVSTLLDNVPAKISEEPLFQDAVKQWKSKINGSADPSNVYGATEDLKKQFQEWGSYNKKMTPLSEQPFRNAAQSVAAGLKDSLEDNNTWGKFGDLQKSINDAYSDLGGVNSTKTIRKNFLTTFAKEIDGNGAGGYEADPGKINTYLNQLSKPGGILKKKILQNMMEASENLGNTIADGHSAMGIQNPYPPISTDVIKSTYDPASISAGARFADYLTKKAPNTIASGIAHTVGAVKGGIVGYKMAEAAIPMLEEGLGRKLTKYGVAGALRALGANDSAGIPQAIDYAEKVGKGTQSINAGVNNLFTVGGQKYLNHDFSEKDREKVKKYVENGSLNQQVQNQATQMPQAQPQKPPGFAHGGEVLAPEPTQPISKPVAPVLHGTDHISTVFPEQSMLLGAAKGRINNYLNSVRPQKIQAKLPFDEDMPDAEKERSYNRAVDIANKPLSILDHIKNGTLDPEHMQHMSGLYPELANHLQKKITDKITESQLDNKKPPYKVRQSMSLFMGAPMDSTLTPQNMMAAQAVFMNQKAPPPNAPVTKNKKSTSKLGEVPGQYRTAEQAAQMRQNQPKD